MKIFKILFFIFLFLSNWSLFSEEGTKIALCTEDKTQDSEISPIAGRAKYFQIYDGSGKLLEVIENPFGTRGMQVGAKVANLMQEKGVKIIVAGRFGPQMLKELQSKNIKTQEFEGTVKKALEVILGKK
ncbi:MAG: NifB/NifX family molybdenum-iron cluster-binding protein [Thermoanaerobaculia bacterium]